MFSGQPIRTERRKMTPMKSHFHWRALAAMCRYLREQKRIPMHVLNTIPSPSSKLVPGETTCHFCSLPLSAPIRISQKATILTMKEVFESVETYYKRCEECGVCYRYQETACGIHNYKTCVNVPPE